MNQFYSQKSMKTKVPISNVGIKNVKKKVARSFILSKCISM